MCREALEYNIKFTMHYTIISTITTQSEEVMEGRECKGYDCPGIFNFPAFFFLCVNW